MREKLHSLKKARIRQSWNKYNLYNLMRQRPLKIEGRTLFQQKYAAKQETRRYHGEHLSKKTWQNIFKHSLHSVVPLNARVLAGGDGSDMAAGRGSGLDVPPGQGKGLGGGPGGPGGPGGKTNTVLKVPYMNQMWAPMERRLDMAVFRSMFASSARQARQFVVHGFVKVNGKKMKHPGYMLNPGDMFSVDPEQVLFATGAPKNLSLKATPKKAVSTESEGEDSTTTTTESEPASATEAEAEAEAESTSEAESTEPGDEDTPALSAARTPGQNRQAHKHPQEQHDPLNPINPAAPYLTPWRPRDYMSPFAFVPKYLEVNFNICHAVYLRHPVARPGSTEVPSPFGPDTTQLAFHWFLRRR
ncbi:hypothetical protein DFH27DRAFT_505470 [Peziza echinospora]|nr:hypothetical protein DFH27DRAFT_505470 [Peziza echinospora]